MVHSIKLCPRYALALTYLLLVLVAGIVTQTVAQSNLSLGLAVYGLTGPFSEGHIYHCPDEIYYCVYFDTVVNGKEYCLYGLPTGTFPAISVTLVDGYEGPCAGGEFQAVGLGLPISGYVGAGGGGLETSGYYPSGYHPSSSFASGTITITIDLTGGTVPYPFTLLVDLTAGGINIQSKVTGQLGTGCTLSNLVSQYAFVKGGGLNLNLQLLATTGSCSSGHLDLTLTFGNPATTLATTTATRAAGLPSLPVGGIMLPSVGFTVLLPWAVFLSLLGVVSVEALVVKRRAKRR